MNREAVALGTPVWTTFQGRLGAVDEQLIADGRLKILERAEDVVLEKRAPGARRRARPPRPGRAGGAARTADFGLTAPVRRRRRSADAVRRRAVEAKPAGLPAPRHPHTSP